jgi:glutamyl-tRNA(Gln) amidotransferase subunit D
MPKKQFTQGKKYKIVSRDKTINEGLFYFENENFIYLKLGSGYNIGISKGNIVSSEEIKKENKQREKSREESKEDRKIPLVVENPEILILHTGGTIASKVDYSTGAVNAKFTPSEMLDLFPELQKIATIDSMLVRNMWSDDMRFGHYNILAKQIEKACESKTLRGIILTHGTDTLHYTASALSFMFENLPIPIILVGSQRSSDRPSSDAALNLISAAYFISRSHENEMKGVFICMHESTNDTSCLILPAQNIKKMHSSRRDAFHCINSGAIAQVNYDEKKIEFLKTKNSGQKKDFEQKKDIILKLFNPDIKIGMLKSRPNLFAEELKIYEKYDGLILEGTGLGHFPIGYEDEESKPNKKILEQLKKISAKIPVCMTAQTGYGRINMNVYSPGRTLKGLGILGHNLDMTSETAYIKLAFLLSNYSADETRVLYATNLRGEISERSEKEEFI